MTTRLTVLGSGTLVPDDDRRSAAHLVEVGDLRMLMDCGAGTVHGMDRFGVRWRALTHLVLSHFHIDHVGDVPALFHAFKHGIRPARTEPLRVLGPRGTESFLTRVGEAFGDSVSEPGFPVEVVELGPRPDGPGETRWTDRGAGVTVVAHPTPHTDRSLCFRIETGHGTVGYTGDTGDDPAVGRFLAGVDVLVAECSLPDPPEVDTHLTPVTVAALAARARPALLLLTHLYPFLDPVGTPVAVGDAGWDGPVRTAWDGTVVELERGSAPRVVVAGGPG